MTKVAIPNFLKMLKGKKREKLNEALAEKARLEKSAYCPCHSSIGITYHICGVTEDEGQRHDLLSVMHRNSSPLKTAREAALRGNVHWHKNKYVQMYCPHVQQGVKQVEVYYDSLGLGSVRSVTVIGRQLADA